MALMKTIFQPRSAKNDFIYPLFFPGCFITSAQPKRRAS
jgi:hypothetical protein